MRNLPRNKSKKRKTCISRVECEYGFVRLENFLSFVMLSKRIKSALSYDESYPFVYIGHVGALPVKH